MLIYCDAYSSQSRMKIQKILYLISLFLLSVTVDSLFSQANEDYALIISPEKLYYETAKELYDERRYEEAIKYFELAASSDKAFGEDRKLNLAYDYIGLGNCCRVLSRFSTALEYYQQALALFRTLEKRDWEVITLGAIGDIYNSLSQFDRARKSFENALSIDNATENKLVGVSILIGLGNSSFYTGQYKEAKKYYQKALDNSEKFGIQDEIPSLLNNLGSVHYTLGQYESSLDYYKRALSKNEELGNDFEAAKNLGNIEEFALLLNAVAAMI